jgi:protein-disulfide isomerase
LEVAENSLVGATCYRKLVLQSRETDKVAYRFELFASPDMRFLSKELMDMTIDPLVEERQKMAALNSGLLAPGAPAQGRVDAPVTIAIFSDFQCPYCARLAETVKDVLPDEADRARLVFHYFPLGMHSWARPAAEAAACAQQQGDAYFWSLHDFLFDHQKEISRDSLLEKLAGHTESLQGFDRQKFDRCVVTRAAISVVDRDLAFGRENGIRATPTVFVNGKQTRIVAPEQLRTLIRQLSQAPRSTAPAGQQ